MRMCLIYFSTKVGNKEDIIFCLIQWWYPKFCNKRQQSKHVMHKYMVLVQSVSANNAFLPVDHILMQPLVAYHDDRVLWHLDRDLIQLQIAGLQPDALIKKFSEHSSRENCYRFVNYLSKRWLDVSKGFFLSFDKKKTQFHSMGDEYHLQGFFSFLFFFFFFFFFFLGI